MTEEEKAIHCKERCSHHRCIYEKGIESGYHNAINDFNIITGKDARRFLKETGLVCLAIMLTLIIFCG